MDNLSAVLDNLVKGYKSRNDIAKEILQAVIDDLNAKILGSRFGASTYHDLIKELQAAMGRIS